MALVVTGTGLIVRQPDSWTGPLSLGMMTSKALILTGSVSTSSHSARAAPALTVLILVYMMGVWAAGALLGNLAVVAG